MYIPIKAELIFFQLSIIIISIWFYLQVQIAEL